MLSNASPKILIVAAEASSCLYARRLLQHWKKTGDQIEAFGIGDAAMEAEGFECLARAEDLAVVGVQEVIAHWSVIKKAFYDVVESVKSRQPDVVLLLDYPGFNLRLAKKLKALGVPVVYYISPQVWAWRTGRVNLIRQVVDKMLVVFPFEVDFYNDHKVQVEFVGHPLLDELKPELFDPKARAFQRAKFGLRDEDTLLALMPGSRRSELKHHLHVQLQAASRLYKKMPHLKIALLVAPNFSKEQIQSLLGEIDFPLMLIHDEPFSMINLADIVLCASGTATLMVGLLEKPMVIMYRMNAMTAFLAKRFVKSTKFFGLINLVLDRLVAPELFQEQAEARHLVEQLEPLLRNPARREQMREELKHAKDRLGSTGATVRVAEALQPYFGRRSTGRES